MRELIIIKNYNFVGSINTFTLNSDFIMLPSFCWLISPRQHSLIHKTILRGRHYFSYFKHGEMKDA